MCDQPDICLLKTSTVFYTYCTQLVALYCLNLLNSLLGSDFVFLVMYRSAKMDLPFKLMLPLTHCLRINNISFGLCLGYNSLVPTIFLFLFPKKFQPRPKNNKKKIKRTLRKNLLYSLKREILCNNDKLPTKVCVSCFLFLLYSI